MNLFVGNLAVFPQQNACPLLGSSFVRNYFKVTVNVIGNEAQTDGNRDAAGGECIRTACNTDCAVADYGCRIISDHPIAYVDDTALRFAHLQATVEGLHPNMGHAVRNIKVFQLRTFVKCILIDRCQRGGKSHRF